MIEYRNEAGELHRDGDEPALIYTNGTKCYYKNGKLDRGNDLPAIESRTGTLQW